ncbi:MAG: hypothetical protein KGJ13_04340 [Patescibacteria group bacterium]|nr:hypothetical protein [Patescibacteria group bacterium]
MSDQRLDKAAKKFAALEKEVAKLNAKFDEIIEGQRHIRAALKDVERACQRKIDFARELQDAANENHHFYLKNLNALLKANKLPTIEEHLQGNSISKKEV